MNIILSSKHNINRYEYIKNVTHFYVDEYGNFVFSNGEDKTVMNKRVIIDKIMNYIPKSEEEYFSDYEERVSLEIHTMTKVLFNRLMDISTKIDKKKNKEVYPINILGSLTAQYFKNKGIENIRNKGE